MLTTLRKNRARIALALAIVLSLLMAKREAAFLQQSELYDFHVYLTAAQLVREHKSAQIYDEADKGEDPQLRYANPGGTFGKTARAKGIETVRLYLYLPALADLLVPLSYLSLFHTSVAWDVLCLLALLGTAAILARLLGHRVFSLSAVGITVCLLLFRPNLIAMYSGQATSFTLLLWVLALWLYVNGRVPSSAVLLAFAAVLKLTPLLVILPMLLWREWRWLRWYSAALALSIVLMMAINGPTTLVDYFVQVLPSMSRGIPSVVNMSVPSAVQVTYLDLTGTNVAQMFLYSPRAVILLAKIVDMACIALVAVQIFRLGNLLSRRERAKILALVALVSVCTAPVSWRHAYSIGFLVLALFWRDALAGISSNVELCLLTLLTVQFSFFIDTYVAKMIRLHGLTHGPLLLLPPILTPATALLFVFYTLHRMRQMRKTVSDHALSQMP